MRCILEREKSYEKGLMLIPVIALDKDGYRLGRGGGFYDRYIEKNRSRLYIVALAFTPSLIEDFKKEPFDVHVDKIITVADEPSKD